ncbi:UNVERIFIED_CONTAM: hypothetical protein GTU68_045522 [Idotea baltica]|nr:hypothetical protein [Idotea baltica]
MDNNNDNKENNNKRFNKFNSFWIYGLIALILLASQLFLDSSFTATKDISFRDFAHYVEQGDVSRVEIINQKYANVYIKSDKLGEARHSEAKKNQFSLSSPAYQFNIGSVETFETKLKELNASIDPENRIDVTYDEKINFWGNLLGWLLPIFLIVAIWLFIMRRMSGGAGGPGSQIFNIGKSKATLFDNSTLKVNVTFEDVAGLDEAKEEVMEVVDFLKQPKKYQALGGKIPKGVLLVGPPGTGKTLLAKAVAGEAGVPFFSISGSDFVEMFVGVGASRVRDLFRQAREKAPCIIFIDEIDAIGRARGRNNVPGGNDERENTLNQLLVEMDGFSTDKGVILMAATNRPDVLDSALLRPGRFDRQIGIDRPDLKGREQIFRVHLKAIKISEEVKPEILAEMTPGFAGLEKKNKLISPEEKEIIAYHEAGHAVCGWFLEHASPLVKVTIVPRGVGTLGYAQYLPKEEYITRTEQLLDRMCMTFGGRAAERIVFDKISTGAQSDLDQVTKMAYSMISIYGMNTKVGNVSFYGLSQDQFSKPYSDDTATLIDDEVRKLIESQYERAQVLLTERRKELNILAEHLLEKEVLLKSDVERLIGPRPYSVPKQHVDAEELAAENSSETVETIEDDKHENI